MLLKYLPERSLFYNTWPHAVMRLPSISNQREEKFCIALKEITARAYFIFSTDATGSDLMKN